jgi:RimJ/RimL family protein N-acetyltransferase
MPNPILLEIPEELFSERLVLRIPCAGRGQMLFEAIEASLNELRPFMSFVHVPISAEICEIDLRRDFAAYILRERITFQIFSRSSAESAPQQASEEFVGEIGFRRLNWELAKFEISYWLDSRQAGKGFMTEAVHTITQFAFETLKAKRVEIRCDSRNTRSRKVAEKSGFALEGILKNNIANTNGLPADECVFARVTW